MKRSLAPLAAVVLLAACASSAERAPVTNAARPAALDPVGTYDFTTNVDGTPVAGVITITRGTSGYVGSISTDVTETIPVSAVTVEGQKMMITGSTPDGSLSIAVTMNGAEFTGTWTLAEMAGTLSGRKRS